MLDLPALRHAVHCLVTIAAVAACGSGPPPPAAPLTPPTRLCRAGSEPPRCRTVDEVEKMLAAPELRILGAASTGSGIQHAKVLTLALPVPDGQVVFRAKWRPFATTSPISQPRNELAAYTVQKLFLEPEDYVVPPVAGRCFPLDVYRQVEPNAVASFSKIRCVFGFLSYWREDLTSLDAAEAEGWFDSQRGPFDADLYERDPIYRSSIGKLNLLTYWIDHDDSHSDQFMLSRNAKHTTVAVVDNSMCLLSPWNETLDQEDDWSRFQVPALPRQAFERLVSLREEALEPLAVIEQYALRDGLLHRMGEEADRTPRGDPSAGIRWVAPDRLQVGLTEGERALLRLRLGWLRDRAERGDYRLF